MTDYIVGEFICNAILIDTNGYITRQIKNFFSTVNCPEYLHEALTASIGISISIKQPDMTFITNILELSKLLPIQAMIKLIKEDMM